MILLQILDEGTITDSQGRKVDFKVCLLHHSALPPCSSLPEYHHLSHKQPWYISLRLTSPFTYPMSLR